MTALAGEPLKGKTAASVAADGGRALTAWRRKRIADKVSLRSKYPMNPASVGSVPMLCPSVRVRGPHVNTRQRPGWPSRRAADRVSCVRWTGCAGVPRPVRATARWPALTWAGVGLAGWSVLWLDDRRRVLACSDPVGGGAAPAGGPAMDAHDARRPETRGHGATRRAGSAGIREPRAPAC